MNGAHDLGGKHGFGAIDRSQLDNFTHSWEEKVFSLTLACGMLGQWNLDQSRFARENTDPAHYLSSSYYEHWLDGLETLLLEKGLITATELKSGQSAGNEVTFSAVTAEQLPRILSSGAPTQLETRGVAEFSVGQTVAVLADSPRGHTRAPGYVKGKCGIVVQRHGCHVFPDQHARDGKKVGRFLYTVQFDAAHLWGEQSAEPASAVLVDLFEPYLCSVENGKVQAGKV